MYSRQRDLYISSVTPVKIRIIFHIIKILCYIIPKQITLPVQTMNKNRIKTYDYEKREFTL